MNGLNGFGAEDGFAVGAGDAQTLGDVVRRFLSGERGSFTAQHDALTKLAKFGKFEFVFQLGLTGQNNLQEFFRGSFQIGEKTNFFKNRKAEILRFIDDKDGIFAGTIALEKPFVELHELLAFVANVAGDVELREDEIEHLAGIDAGIEEKSGACAALMEPLEQTVDESGLAGADFAGESDEAFAGLNAVHQASQSFFGLLGEKQIAGVGIDVKRVFF